MELNEDLMSHAEPLADLTQKKRGGCCGFAVRAGVTVCGGEEEETGSLRSAQR